MSACLDCGREMQLADGCAHRLYLFVGDAKLYDPLVYGSPEEAWFKHTQVPTDPSHRCHDCGCKLGQYHHIGCDVERCPACKGQLISCGHEIAEVI